MPRPARRTWSRSLRSGEPGPRSPRYARGGSTPCFRLNRERELTVVLVSHDINLAAWDASRLADLYGGRAAADRSPASVLTPDLIRAVYGIEALVERNPRPAPPSPSRSGPWTPVF